MSANLENPAVATRLEEVIQFPRRAVLKNVQTTGQFSHANKVILKILQARLQYYVNGELPDV